MIVIFVAILVLLMGVMGDTTERGLVSESCRNTVRATCGPDSKYACSDYTCLKSCIKENMAILKAAGCTRHRRTLRTKFPASWGPPPAAQTKDLRPLPGGYGQGSGTLARWIQEKMTQDAAIKSQRGINSFT